MKKTFLALLLCALTVAVGSDLAIAQKSRVSYKTYANARFNYSISYPVGILTPQGEAANGDGQAFVSNDGQTRMLVYGHNQLDGESLSKAFQGAQHGDADRPRVVTYKVLKANFYVVTGTDDGKIFYEKTMLKNGVFKTFSIEYPTSQKATFDTITAKVAASFVG